MTKLKYFSLLWLLFLLSLSSTNAYLLWLKSADNTIENILNIEQIHKIRIPLVGFIFDPRWPHIIETLNKLPSTLWIDRIYHLTLSPNYYSAQEVADGKFDKEYNEFFKSIKDNDLRVVFRTMHEMNGWRYPRSSNPSAFKNAWIHVRKLSREADLSTRNILFDFSVNHRDMPTKQKPSQTAKLIACQFSWKEKIWCYTFEDYYPGDKYVDIIGFTFYNRGKWFADRKRLTPAQIVYEKGRNPLQRIKKFNKPIMIDEVGTTAVRYEENFNYNLSREIYKTNYKLKNTWLRQLQQLLWKEKSIIWTVYFNVDYTKWLTRKLIGEADRSVINLETNKVYNTFFSLLKNSEDFHLRSPLLNLFGVGLMKIDDKEHFIPIKLIPKIRTLQSALHKLWKTDEERKNLLESIWINELKKMFSDITDEERSLILEFIK